MVNFSQLLISTTLIGAILVAASPIPQPHPGVRQSLGKVFTRTKNFVKGGASQSVPPPEKSQPSALKKKRNRRISRVGGHFMAVESRAARRWVNYGLPGLPVTGNFALPRKLWLCYTLGFRAIGSIHHSGKFI
ncbi:hypothetical protein BJ085DRAFT_31810 [Dimargaris cristalligena]|uniref:Uncharacterized protein n=1 Tax=Dimargaris cristalligena TaxID=215637 RepID=A0A4P9ZMD0_9FUNG|nr:hypothetical protein BJ085DRAFT_31810 [Dimargaris cristalligena]|eukprot:RKP34417.1 hypothetical protein BJ085DRAFT_31810 [Dimargaris cristalligena]